MVVLLSLLCGLWGCSGGWTDYHDNIDYVNQHTTGISYLDSLANYAVDSAGIECEELSCRGMEIETNDYRNKKDSMYLDAPLTIYIEQNISGIRSAEDGSMWQNHFYLDIYGCRTVDCHDAEKIVFRDKDYNYTILFEKDDFSISKLPHSEMLNAKGDVYVIRYFNLKIDKDGFRIDWNVQIANSEYTEWVDYHITPIWG